MSGREMAEILGLREAEVLDVDLDLDLANLKWREVELDLPFDQEVPGEE